MPSLNGLRTYHFLSTVLRNKTDQAPALGGVNNAVETSTIEENKVIPCRIRANRVMGQCDWGPKGLHLSGLSQEEDTRY